MWHGKKGEAPRASRTLRDLHATMTPLLDFLLEMEASEEISRRDHSLVGSLLRNRLRHFLEGAEVDPAVSPYDIERVRRRLMEMESSWVSAGQRPVPDGLADGVSAVDFEHLSEVLEA